MWFRLKFLQLSYCLKQPLIKGQFFPVASLNERISLRFRSNTAVGNCSDEIACEKHVLKSPYSDVLIPSNDSMTLTQFIFDKQEKYAGEKSIVDGENGQTFTHLQTRELSLSFSSALSNLGISPGEIVAIVSPNCPEFVFSFLGISSAGAIPTAVNYGFTADEIKFQLQNSNSIAVVCHEDKLELVKKACENLPTIRHIISMGKSCTGVHSFKELIKEEDGSGISQTLKINARDDVALMPYSSGTSGLPKGVMLTHRNIIANLQQTLHPEVLFLSPTEVKQEILLGVLPFYHIYAMLLNMMISLCVGGQLITMKEFQQKNFVRLLLQYKPTTLTLVPPLISFTESSELVSVETLSSVTSILCGAAPLGETLIEKFFTKFGRKIRFIEGYGLTETSPVALASRKDQYIVGSCGVPIPNTFVKLVDAESGKSVDPAEGEGELCVKGPQVMKGYYNNETATRATIDPNGWLHTGDIARIDHDGNVFILDRLKDLIKVKGLQVAPAELENLIREHESVEDVAVIGVPDERAGERPRAYVVPKRKNASLTERTEGQDRIKSYVADKVARHKRIESVIFVDEIPKSASGKILKKDLRSSKAIP